MISIVYKIIWEHWEVLFKYLNSVQPEKYLVYLWMFTAYSNILIFSLSHCLNETSVYMNNLWLKLNLGKMLVMFLEKGDTC